MDVKYNDIYRQEHQNRQLFHNQMVYCPKEKEYTSVIVDTNSVARNSASMVKSIAPLPLLAGGLINSSAILGGVLGVPIGSASVRDSFLKAKAAYQCGDKEGIALNTLGGTFGASFVAISGMLAADGVAGLSDIALPAVMNPLFGGLGIGMNGVLLASSSYGLSKGCQFNKELKTILEKGGEREAINWLNKQVTLTTQEVKEIRRTAKDPEGEIRKLLQKKWNVFEFRTSAVCGKVVREKLPGLLKEFNSQQAQALIQEVRKANFMGRVKHVCLLLIAVISIVAFTCLFIASGPASPILFAIGAVVWLAVDSSSLHKYIGEKCWNWHLNRECPTQPKIA